MKLNDKIKARIRLIYGIALSAMLFITGILFICSCYAIYKSGSSPFTRESIGEAFSLIAVHVYLTVASVIGGAVISIVMPDEEGKLVGLRAPAVVLKKLAEKVDLKSLDEQNKADIEKERCLRKILTYVNIALAAIVAIAPLFYLMNPANFPAVSGEYNAEISHGMLVYLAFLAPLAVYEVVYVILFDLSCKREAELCKAAIKAGGLQAAQDNTNACPIRRALAYLKENEGSVILGVRIALVCCAIVFIIAGTVNGGMVDVLNKAIKICTECIGLG